MSPPLKLTTAPNATGQPNTNAPPRRRRHHGRRKKTVQISEVDFPVQKTQRIPSSPRDIAQQEEAKDVWFDQKLALLRKSPSSPLVSATSAQDTTPQPQFKISQKYNIVIAFKEKAVARWIQTHITENPAMQLVGMDFEWDCVSAHSPKHSTAATFPDLIQIATESSCLLYQVRRNRPAEAFVDFMRDHSIAKCMVDPSSDLLKLSNWFRSFNVPIYMPPPQEEVVQSASADEVTDGECTPLELAREIHSLTAPAVPEKPTLLTGDALKDVKQLKLCFPSIVNLDMHHEGAAALCLKHFGLHLNKSPGIVLSRWSRFTLHKEQVEYAVCDALLNVKLAALLLKTSSQE